jgi:hypothetical protein
MTDNIGRLRTKDEAFPSSSRCAPSDNLCGQQTVAHFLLRSSYQVFVSIVIAVTAEGRSPSRIPSTKQPIYESSNGQVVVIITGVNCVSSFVWQ